MNRQKGLLWREEEELSKKKKKTEKRQEKKVGVKKIFRSEYTGGEMEIEKRK